MTEKPAMTDWDPMAEKVELERVLAAGIELRPGDRVILRPAAARTGLT